MNRLASRTASAIAVSVVAGSAAIATATALPLVASKPAHAVARAVPVPRAKAAPVAVAKTLPAPAPAAKARPVPIARPFSAAPAAKARPVPDPADNSCSSKNALHVVAEAVGCLQQQRPSPCQLRRPSRSPPRARDPKPAATSARAVYPTLEDCASKAQAEPSEVTLFCADANDTLTKLAWKHWGKGQRPDDRHRRDQPLRAELCRRPEHGATASVSVSDMQTEPAGQRYGQLTVSLPASLPGHEQG